MSILNQLLNRQPLSDDIQPQVNIQNLLAQQPDQRQENLLAKLSLLNELMKFRREPQQPQPMPPMPDLNFQLPEIGQPFDPLEMRRQYLDEENARQKEARLARTEARNVEEFGRKRSIEDNTRAAAREIYGLSQDEKKDWANWQSVLEKYPNADATLFNEQFNNHVNELAKIRNERLKISSKQLPNTAYDRKARIDYLYKDRIRLNELLDKGINELGMPIDANKIEAKLKQNDYDIKKASNPDFDPTEDLNPARINKVAESVRLHLNGYYTPEDIDKIVDGIKKNASGVGNAIAYRKSLISDIAKIKAEQKQQKQQKEKPKKKQAVKKKPERWARPDTDTGYEKWSGLKGAMKLHETLKKKREAYIGE